MSAKYALIIGNTEYADPGLAQLTAPGKDAEDFARVLKHQEICAFDDVNVLMNQPSYVVGEAIDVFFYQKKPDDLLIVYFSGHGVRDEFGALYLAVKNTNRARLRATAIRSDYIREAMDQSRSKRQVVILDCCNSGAFPQGTKAEVGGMMGMVSALQGYGRFVLTASDATQFAWEGDTIIGDTQNSLFTHFLVKGLEGEADRDGDGRITVDEIYDYAFEQISQLTPKQTPTKSSSKQEGEIVLRQIMRIEDIKPVSLPGELMEEIEDTRPYVREAAVQKLEKILKGRNIGLARSARVALEKIAIDDNTTRRVSQMATQLLESVRLAEQKAEEERKVREEAERLAILKAEEERMARERAEVERKAKEEAERLLAEQRAEEERKARAKAERLAALKAEEERLAKKKAEEERSAREEAERLAALKSEEERLVREKAEAERKAREEAEKLLQAQAESETAKREAAELAAYHAVEKAAREKSEKETAGQEAEKKAVLEALEFTSREKAKRETAAKATIKESKTTKPSLLTVGIIGTVTFVLILCGYGMTRLLSSLLGSRTEATATKEQNVIFTEAALTLQVLLTQAAPFSTSTLPPTLTTSVPSSYNNFSNFQVISDTPGEIQFTVDYNYNGENGNILFSAGCLYQGQRQDCVDQESTNFAPHPGPSNGTLVFRLGLYGPNSATTDQIFVGMYVWGPSTNVAYQVFDYEKEWTIVLPTPTMVR